MGSLPIGLVVWGGWAIGFQVDAAEPLDGLVEAVAELHAGLPPEPLSGEGDVGLAPAWIVARYVFPGRRLLVGLLTALFVLPTVVVAAANAATMARISGSHMAGNALVPA